MRAVQKKSTRTVGIFKSLGNKWSESERAREKKKKFKHNKMLLREWGGEGGEVGIKSPTIIIRTIIFSPLSIST